MRKNGSPDPFFIKMLLFQHNKHKNNINNIVNSCRIWYNYIERHSQIIKQEGTINESNDLYVRINQFFAKEERLIDGIDNAAKKILGNEKLEAAILEKAKRILEGLAAEGKI